VAEALPPAVRVDLSKIEMPRLVRTGHGRTLAMLVVAMIMFSGCQAISIQDAESLLVPSLQKSELWGLIAGFGTTFASAPDLIAMLKRRSSAGLHPRMASILAVFQVTWMYYGLLIESRPVVAWNAIAVLINSMTVAAYAHFRRRDRAMNRDRRHT
jgi:uncharacterized protein with PQ loop repeat